MDNENILRMLLLSGGPLRIDGFTFFLKNGKVQKCKSKHTSPKSRTEGEVRSSDRFREARKIWRVYRLAIGDLSIWRVAARERGFMKSDSCFHSVNGGSLRPNEGVWAFQAFQFSVGTLDMPQVTSVDRDGWKVTICWENDVDCPKSAASDRVFVGYFFETERRSPMLVRAEGVCRGDGRVEIDIPPVEQPDGTPLHLYLFFGNEALNRFSPSGYLAI